MYLYRVWIHSIDIDKYYSALTIKFILNRVFTSNMLKVDLQRTVLIKIYKIKNIKYFLKYFPYLKEIHLKRK